MIHRYRFISEHHAVYGVTRLCRVLAVKRRQGYYEWLAAAPARPDGSRQTSSSQRRSGRFTASTVAPTGHRGSPPNYAAKASRSTANASSGSCGNAASWGSPAGAAGR